MEPQGSLPSSQTTTTASRPAPDRSNPHHILLSKINFNTVPIYAYFSKVVSSLQIFQLKCCMHFWCPPRVLHASSILSLKLLCFGIKSNQQRIKRNTTSEKIRYKPYGTQEKRRILKFYSAKVWIVCWYHEQDGTCHFGCNQLTDRELQWQSQWPWSPHFMFDLCWLWPCNQSAPAVWNLPSFPSFDHQSLFSTSNTATSLNLIKT
jgi:hypothetical protein